MHFHCTAARESRLPPSADRCMLQGVFLRGAGSGKKDERGLAGPVNSSINRQAILSAHERARNSSRIVLLAPQPASCKCQNCMASTPTSTSSPSPTGTSTWCSYGITLASRARGLRLSVVAPFRRRRVSRLTVVVLLGAIVQLVVCLRWFIRVPLSNGVPAHNNNMEFQLKL